MNWKIAWHVLRGRPIIYRFILRGGEVEAMGRKALISKIKTEGAVKIIAAPKDVV